MVFLLKGRNCLEVYSILDIPYSKYITVDAYSWEMLLQKDKSRLFQQPPAILSRKKLEKRSKPENPPEILVIPTQEEHIPEVGIQSYSWH